MQYALERNNSTQNINKHFCERDLMGGSKDNIKITNASLTCYHLVYFFKQQRLAHI
jgi:hypothetical protein